MQRKTDGTTCTDHRPCPARREFLTVAIIGLAGAPAAVAAAQTPVAPEIQAAADKALAECRQANDLARTEEQAAYGKALVARLGPAVLDTIRETTIARAKAWLSSPDIQTRDLSAVKTLLWDQLGERFAFVVVEQTPSTLRFKVTRCPLAERMRGLDAAELGFAYYCAYDYGFCQGLNPALQFSRTKTLMQGADSCDHAYVLKETPAR